MQYLLLIYSAESVEAASTTAPSWPSTASSPRASSRARLQVGRPAEAGEHSHHGADREGKTLTTDGPFAETREQLGGYYLIEANDLDAAVAIAAKVPHRQVRLDRGAAVWAMNG